MAELRVQSRFLEKPRIEELLKTRKDGVLSLTDGKSAYGVPVAYTSYHDDSLYFGMNPSGRKYDCFKLCKNVSFTIYQTFPAPAGQPGMGWWSIILDGELSQVTDPSEIRAVADRMEREGAFPPGLKDKFLERILANAANSNFFKMKITCFGGKELPVYKPEEELK